MWQPEHDIYPCIFNRRLPAIRIDQLWKDQMTTPAGTRGPTCTDYRGEMLLLSLHRQLADPALTEAERQQIRGLIARLESEMGLD